MANLHHQDWATSSSSEELISPVDPNEKNVVQFFGNWEVIENYHETTQTTETEEGIPSSVNSINAINEEQVSLLHEDKEDKVYSTKADTNFVWSLFNLCNDILVRNLFKLIRFHRVFFLDKGY